MQKIKKIISCVLLVFFLTSSRSIGSIFAEPKDIEKGSCYSKEAQTGYLIEYKNDD